MSSWWHNSTGQLVQVYNAKVNKRSGQWLASSGAMYNMLDNKLRPLGWTSADAAGLPMFPGLVKYEETVVQGYIDHAIRFTGPNSRAAYQLPATHFAPHGMIQQMRHPNSAAPNSDLHASGFMQNQQPKVSDPKPVQPDKLLDENIGNGGVEAETWLFQMETYYIFLTSRNQSILAEAYKIQYASSLLRGQAWQWFGLIFADNGSPWFLTGEANAKWDPLVDEIHDDLARIRGSDMEVVDTGVCLCLDADCTRSEPGGASSSCA
eukprot:gene17225-23549_t